MESSEEIGQKVDLLALAAQWKVEPGAPLPSARSGDGLGSLAGLRPHRQPGKEQKAPAAPIPAWGTFCPLWVLRDISLFAPSPSQSRGKGLPASRGGSPGGAPAAAPQGPAGGPCPDGRPSRARGRAATRVQVLAASASTLLAPQVHGLRRSEGGAVHLPFELFPHGC